MMGGIGKKWLDRLLALAVVWLDGGVCWNRIMKKIE
jgi:hypothetical protein